VEQQYFTAKHLYATRVYRAIEKPLTAAGEKSNPPNEIKIIAMM